MCVSLMLPPALPALEPLPALGALEARLVFVHEKMLPQVRRPRKRPRTLWALEGPLPAVDPLVGAQVGGVGHPRAAVTALVALLSLSVTRPADMKRWIRVMI